MTMKKADDLRGRIASMSKEEWHDESAKRELEYYRATNRYCGSCGAETEAGEGLAIICKNCGREIFPSLSPAIVVLVTRGEKALLVHARNFRESMFALVAGFVEPGETLEECVAREVLEETGLEVDCVRYRGSQAWPFPAQLMVGFTARWRGGEIQFRDGELSAGGWFSRDSLPVLPRPGSLSRLIIDDWICGRIPGEACCSLINT